MVARTLAAYERWAPTYDSDPNPLTALESPEVVAALADVRGDSTVLDAACGTGRYLPYLAERAGRVIGFDAVPGMMVRARRRCPEVRLFRADLMAGLPVASHTMTHVLCAQTLKHCPTLAVPIEEFGRVLRPGGHLVFSVAHPEMDWTGYEMRTQPDFILSLEADIYQHAMTDYVAALEDARFRSVTVEAVPVTERIAEFLTPESFELVRGRPQVAVFRAELSNTAA